MNILTRLIYNMPTDKNAAIAESLKETREKRKGQQCRVFTMKVDMKALSSAQREVIKMQFVEAKWITNEALAAENVFKHKTGKSVKRRDKDGNEIETLLQYLGSQMKQSVVEELHSNIKTLSTLKSTGKKVGKIRFKREVTAINLKQYGSTHRILNQKHIAIQKVPGKIRVFGLHQLMSRKGNIKFDIANAKLLNTPQGYFVAITAYSATAKRKHNGQEIGIDFGISTNITLSNGRQFHASVQESERLKKLQRKFAKQKKYSKRRYKTLQMIKREYQKLTHKKNDIANKIVSEILKYEHIYMQDENLRGWKKIFGKQVHHSVMGRVKAKLKPHLTYMLPRNAPTTKLCTACGTIHRNMTLAIRMFTCECGVIEDRDVHAAQNMIAMSKIKLGQELSESTLAEIDIRLDDQGQIAVIDETRRSIFKTGLNARLVQEDARSLA